MDVSIIFVNYKTKDLTINAIKSVFEKTKGIDFEIFVVDNNSHDGSIEAIEKEFPNINIIKNTLNAGFGAANNIAIKQANGKYILCLNTDTLLINNAIKIMYDFMEKEENQNVAVCGSVLFNKDLTLGICGGNFPNVTEIFWKVGLRNIFKRKYLKYKLTLTADQIGDQSNIDYVTGADIFFRKSVLDEVGLFDENIFMYFEETDLCKRIRDNGYDIKIIKDAKIIHLEGQSNNNILKKKKLSKQSEFYYFRKHYPNQIWLVKTLYVILYFIDWIILKNSDSKHLLKEVITYEQCLYI